MEECKSDMQLANTDQELLFRLPASKYRKEAVVVALVNKKKEAEYSVERNRDPPVAAAPKIKTKKEAFLVLAKRARPARTKIKSMISDHLQVHRRAKRIRFRVG